MLKKQQIMSGYTFKYISVLCSCVFPWHHSSLEYFYWRFYCSCTSMGRNNIERVCLKAAHTFLTHLSCENLYKLTARMICAHISLRRCSGQPTLWGLWCIRHFAISWDNWRVVPGVQLGFGGCGINSCVVPCDPLSLKRFLIVLLTFSMCLHR